MCPAPYMNRSYNSDNSCPRNGGWSLISNSSSSSSSFGSPYFLLNSSYSLMVCSRSLMVIPPLFVAR